MTFSLDTNVMIDIVNRQKPQVRARFDEALNSGTQIVTCAVAAHELVYGAMISARPEVHVKRANELLGDLQIVDWAYEDAHHTAVIRQSLRQQGLTIGAWDSLIAGQALHRGWTMVSHNLHEFTRIEGLEVVDWTAA